MRLQVIAVALLDLAAQRLSFYVIPSEQPALAPGEQWWRRFAPHVEPGSLECKIAVFCAPQIVIAAVVCMQLKGVYGGELPVSAPATAPASQACTLFPFFSTCVRVCICFKDLDMFQVTSQGKI